MICKSFPEQLNDAQKIQKTINDAITYKGRETVSRLLAISPQRTNQFCCGESIEDSEINIQSISELLAGLGISVCPPDAIPVEKSLVQWAWLTCRNSLGYGEWLKKIRVQYELHFNESILKISDQ